MCYLVYTNFQRQGAAMNMTAGEVMAAKQCREYRIVSVWEHKTTSSHGSAKIAIHQRVYRLILRYSLSETHTYP